jgi:branched-subunit amino acid ABC-type transport system permease component
VIGILLGLVYRYTRFGLATRAAAGNERGAALIGLSANRLSAYNWVLATVLAGVAGILILPITTLNPGTYTLFIVPALGAALLARFTSFPLTVAAGLGLGMFQSFLVKLQAVWSWLPQQGLQDGVPFILIMIAIVVLARRLPSRGQIAETHTSSIGRPVKPLRTTAISFVIGLVAILVFSELYRSAIASSLIVACVCLSVVVITGYVGQISLAQNAFAGISAFMMSHIAQWIGLGFPSASSSPRCARSSWASSSASLRCASAASTWRWPRSRWRRRWTRWSSTRRGSAAATRAGRSRCPTCWDLTWASPRPAARSCSRSSCWSSSA